MTKSELGYGIAGFLISIMTLIELIRNDIFAIEQAIKIIKFSRAFMQPSDFLPDDAESLSSTDYALKMAEEILNSLMVQKLSS